MINGERWVERRKEKGEMRKEKGKKEKGRTLPQPLCKRGMNWV